jgi:hypothetical protein
MDINEPARVGAIAVEDETNGRVSLSFPDTGMTVDYNTAINLAVHIIDATIQIMVRNGVTDFPPKISVILKKDKVH